MNLKTLAAIAGIALVAAVAVVGTKGGSGADEARAERSAGRMVGRSPDGKGSLARRKAPKAGSAREVVRDALERSNVKKNGKPRAGDLRPMVEYAHLEGKDRAAAIQIQSALDQEDFERVLAASEEALRSSSPEVRGYAVEALGWFGTDALPELTGAMADPDEDVASAAANAWELAVSDLDDATQRLNLAMATVSVLTDPEQLNSISGILSNAADELIDGAADEATAARYRLEIVQALVDIIDGNGPAACAEQARETYEDITGEAWAGIDAAEDFLREAAGAGDEVEGETNS